MWHWLILQAWGGTFTSMNVTSRSVVWRDGLWIIILQISIAQGSECLLDLLTEGHEYNISTILHGSVHGNTVGVLKAWNISIPGPLTTDQRSGESELVPSFSLSFSLNVRGGLAFGCEAQCLRGTKREGAHLGADARVRPRRSTWWAAQQTQ